jgi:glycosyltransferase involved in cell wall biosynthesis
MRPRVAIDATPLLYTANGIGRTTRALVEGVLRASERDEMDVVLFGRRLSGAALAQRVPGAGQTVHLRLPRKAEWLIGKLGLIEWTCGADLYHATDFYSPLNRPQDSLATMHDVIFLRNPEPMVDHVRLARWAGAFARQARGVITCSHWCKQDIVRTLGVDPAKIHVTYWGVDRQLFRPEPDRAALGQRLKSSVNVAGPYFLAVSCSTSRKNTPRLLAAYEHLLPDHPANQLILVWDAPPEIRQRYAVQQEQGRIRFIGRVNDQLLRDLYCGATAMLFPSLDEGFGLPVLEAMACGTPVITSNRTCLPEIAGGAAVLVNPEDQPALVSAMARFESGDPALAELPQKGLARAAEFTWDRCLQQTLGVYRQALAMN